MLHVCYMCVPKPKLDLHLSNTLHLLVVGSMEQWCSMCMHGAVTLLVLEDYITMYVTL